MPNQIVHERIQQLTSEYRAFVLSDFAEKTANVFGASLKFDEDRIAVLENGIALFLLFFLDKKAFTEFLVNECDLTPNASYEVVNTILSGLPKGMVEGMNASYNALNVGENQQKPVQFEEPEEQLIPTPTSAPTPPAAPSSVTNPTTPSVESVEQSAPQPELEPVHTMEHDMDKIHGYGAYRKMYPDASGGESEAPAPTHESEPVLKATSQDDVLSGRTPLTDIPSYTETPKE